LYQLPDGFAGLRAGFEPTDGLLLIHMDLRRVAIGVVSTNLINEPAIARRPCICHHDSEERFFAATMTAQPDHKSHERYDLSFGRVMRT